MEQHFAPQVLVAIDQHFAPQVLVAIDQHFAPQVLVAIDQHFASQLSIFMKQHFASELPNHHHLFFSFLPLTITTFNIKTAISLLIVNSNELNQKDERKKN